MGPFRAGTMPIQLAGNIKQGGPVSRPRSASRSANWSTIVGGGTFSGTAGARPSRVGGPLGAYFPRELFDTPLRLRGPSRRATA